MNNYLIIAAVPLGQAEKVIKTVNEAGAAGAAVIHARGTYKAAKESFLGLHIEPEEEIILIKANKETADDLCTSLHNEFKENHQRSGFVYVLPLMEGIESD